MKILFIQEYYEDIEISNLCDLTPWNKTDKSDSACILIKPSTIVYKETFYIFIF